MSYKFRVEGTDEIVELSFLEMMDKDAAGYVTLEDGRVAREIRPSCKCGGGKREKITGSYWDTGLVSDALGFHPEQLADFEKDRKANGFSAVEFRKDPNGHLMQAVIHCPKQHQEYIKHRGLVDKNGSTRSKVHLSEEDFEKARRLIEREHPNAEL